MKHLQLPVLFSFLVLAALSSLRSQPTDTLHLIGVGDIMLGTNYPSPNHLPPHGGKDLLAKATPTLRAADVTIGNLEGTMFDGTGTPKQCRDQTKCYVFRSPAAYAAHLTEAGFDLLSVANNHSGDFGPAGRKGTQAVLQSHDIAFAGWAGTHESVVITRKGLRIGFCAFAPNSGTCDIRDIKRATALVADLEKRCDVVVVSFHGGAEGAGNQHVPRKTETYLGENRGDVHAFSHAVIDAGADLVLGHGPHVPRAMELYKGRLVAYSLGNFCTYGRFSLQGPAGAAPLLEVFTDRRGAFLYGNIVPYHQQKSHGPYPDPNREAVRLIRQLTQADFPDSGLLIGEDGAIRIRQN